MTGDAAALGSLVSVGGFVLKEPLGQGAFATVYRVEDPSSGAQFALKCLSTRRPLGPRQLLRFSREVEIASSIRHPNLGRVISAGEQDNQPFCVMELIDGPTLEQLVLAHRPRGTATPEWQRRVLRLGGPLFSAVQHLHNHRIVHRDIKPDNVIVQSGDVPRLIDFGLAVSQSAEAQRSDEGHAPGTILYMAPELFSRQDADRRSDLYALGLTMFHLITGRHPWGVDIARDGTASIIFKIISGTPLDLRTVEPACPPSLEAVLRRMTAAEPSDRYFSVAEALLGWQAAMAEWIGGASESSCLVAMDGEACQPLEPSFIGRSRELAALTAALQLVRAGQPQCVVVQGETGIGRSRLLTTWARRHAGAVPNHVGQAVENDAPYGVWKRALGEPLLSLAADASSVRTVEPALEARAIEGYYGRVFRKLQDLTADGPHIVMLDNFQWADPASMELLEYTTRRLADIKLGIFLVVAFRDDSIAEFAALALWLQRLRRLPCGLALSLPRLSPPETAHLAGQALGQGARSLPPGLEEHLAHRTGGNPLACLQMLRQHMADGSLRFESDGWHWDPPAASSAAQEAGLAERWLPGALRTPTSARLSAEERHLLDVCAVGRSGFTFDELVDVTEWSPRTVLDRVETLIASHLLQEVATDAMVAYSFVDPRDQYSVSQHLSESRKLVLHRDWTRSLRHAVATHGDRAFRLLYHCEEARDWAACFPELRLAVTRAGRTHAFRHAVDICQRMLAAHQAEPYLAEDDADALRVQAAHLALSAGESTLALELTTGLAERLSDPSARFRLWHLRARAHYTVALYKEAQEDWRRGLAELGLCMPGGRVGLVVHGLRGAHNWLTIRNLAAIYGAHPELVEVCTGMFRSAMFQGAPANTRSLLFTHGLVAQLAAATDDARIRALYHHGQVHRYATRKPPAWAAATIHAEGARRAMQSHKDPLYQLELYRDIGIFALLCGDLDAAVQSSKTGESLAREVEDTHGLAWMYHVRGMAQFATSLSTATIQHSLDLATECGNEHVHHMSYLWLATATAWQGDEAQAMQYLRQYQDRRFQSPLPQRSFLSHSGIVYAACGRAAEAESSLWMAWDLHGKLFLGSLWRLMVAHPLATVLADAYRRAPSPDKLERLGQVASASNREAGQVPFLQCRSLSIQAELDGVRDKFDRAFQRYQQAEDLAQTNGYWTVLALIQADHGRLLRHAERRGVTDKVRDAMLTCERIGAPARRTALERWLASSTG